MKNLRLILCMLFVSTALFAQQPGNYEIGDEIRNHIIIDTDGVEWELHDITATGKYIYIDFFTVDCFPCRDVAPLFNEFHDTYGCNEGPLFMMSMTAGNDDDAAVIAFGEEFGGEFNHAPAISKDGGSLLVVADFGVSFYPTVWLIGPDNKLLVNDIWPLDDLDAFVNTIPVTANAQPMACSLGVDDSNIFDVSLYPNPVSEDTFTILLGANINQATVTIFNILGAVVYSEAHNTNQITINAEMASGKYIVSVKTSQGILNKALVVE